MKYHAVAFTLVCALNISSVAASPHPWRTLAPSQQEALAPMSMQWDGLPEAQQQNLLEVAKHYPKLSPEEKRRFLDRLGAWGRLTPEQRQAAREKYRAFNEVPEDKREEVKKMVREEQARKTQHPWRRSVRHNISIPSNMNRPVIAVALMKGCQSL